MFTTAGLQIQPNVANPAELKNKKVKLLVFILGRICNPLFGRISLFGRICNPTDLNEYSVRADLQSARNKYHPTMTSPIQRLLLTVS